MRGSEAILACPRAGGLGPEMAFHLAPSQVQVEATPFVEAYRRTRPPIGSKAAQPNWSGGPLPLSMDHFTPSHAQVSELKIWLAGSVRPPNPITVFRIGS